ncbi:serine/threonine-protein kinase [Actinomycetospora straminea]|uniref:Protein kinase domain-containing protein n=1 Tax=Actinomycetospora straminea TaxID=663607 RepID=A0ABP9E2D5_9PSEU|nr:serine/threonine-protein kinase [Actinomycetospora straminea]MDD7934581.1 serine/threonine-protein kinase [Actinomycetospora straminea]
MGLAELGPGLPVLVVVVAGVLTALAMAPLHRRAARQRRTAMLVDRVVTDRVARLSGAERRRARRHLHRAADLPLPRALGLTVLTAAATAVVGALVVSLVADQLAAGRRTVVRGLIARLEDAGLPAPTSAGPTITVTGIVVLALLSLATAGLYVGGLDVERRRAMPVTRPWPTSRGTATLLLGLLLGLALVLTGGSLAVPGVALGAALFLLSHQIVTRIGRPSACREAPVVPEALRAARLPAVKERRLLRARRPRGEDAPALPSPSPAPAPSGPPRSMPPRVPVPPPPVVGPSTRLVDLAAPEQPLTPHDPRSVGEYALTGRLGSGGMGTVYLGHRAGTHGSVAIKVLAPHLLDDVDARTRFLREGQTLQKVTGDYTARVYSVGFDGSMPYIVMERLDGPSLHAFVAASGAVTDGEMLTRTAIALARALAALHADGITHRDLKPGNVLLTSAGPKVVDFGIARVVGQTHHTPAGNMVGTPGYMAPEQVTGNGAVPATDVWAWACCVVFAARGDHLFDGDNILDIARRILDGPGPEAFAAVHRLSPRLVPVLRRATAQEVGDRPRDGAALLRLLDRSGATAAVGAAGWDRLVGGGVR